MMSFLSLLSLSKCGEEKTNFSDLLKKSSDVKEKLSYKLRWFSENAGKYQKLPRT